MEAVKVYQTTKEECQKQIQGVCEGCGGELEPIETVNNANEPTYWVGCMKCHCFRAGIEKKYVDIARELISNKVLFCYRSGDSNDLDNPDKREYYISSEAAGLSRKIRTIEDMLKAL